MEKERFEKEKKKTKNYVRKSENGERKVRERREKV